MPGEQKVACRVCGRETIHQGDCFCEHCGWPTTRLELTGYPPDEVPEIRTNVQVPAGGEKFGTSFLLRRVGPGKTSVTVRLTSAPEWVTLARGDDENVVHQFDLEEGHVEERIALRFYRGIADRQRQGRSVFAGVLTIESNDGAPSAETSDDIFRPYDRSCRRTERKVIDIKLLEPARLLVEQEALLFSRKRQQRELRITNVGESAMRVPAPACPAGYTIRDQAGEPIIPGSEMGPVGSGKTVSPTVAPTDPARAPLATLDIDAGPAGQASVLLREDPRPEARPQGALPWYIIGYDFGTHKTAVCFLDNWQRDADIQTVPLGEEGGPTMRSTISIEQNEGAWVIRVGDEAQRTLPLAARDDAGDQAAAERFWVKESIKTLLRSGKPVRIFGQERPLSWVVGEFLSRVESRVNEHLAGGRERACIFGLPVLDEGAGEEEASEGLAGAYELQEANTSEAARHAGITEPIFQLEPQCAARYVIHKAWTSGEPPIKSGDVVCVWDFGGGTLDVSILVIDIQGRELSLRVVADLGRFVAEGRDISGDRVDELVFEHLRQQEGWKVADGTVLDATGSTLFSYDLRTDVARQAKEALNTQVDGEYLEIIECPHAQLRSVLLARSDFEKLVQGDIAAALQRLKQEIDKHDELSGGSIDHFFLVGGSSLMPIVPRMVHEAFPNSSIVDPPPDEQGRDDAVMAVARGAVLANEVQIKNVLGFRVVAEPILPSGEAGRALEVFSPTTLFPAQRSHLISSPHADERWGLVFEYGDERWRVATFGVPAGVSDDDRVALVFQVDAGGQLKVTTKVSKGTTQEPERKVWAGYDL